MGFLRKHKVEVFLLMALIAGYFVLRLPNLTSQPIFADEAIYIRWAQVMKSEPTLRFLPLSDGKTPLFMWSMMPLFKIFEDPLFAGRFLSIVSGFFTLLGVYFLSKKIFGEKVALWSSFLYVVTPYTVFFDRMALVDSMLSAFTVWIIYFALWLIKSPRLDLAMILGYLMGGAILTKTPGMINLLILPMAVVGFIKKKSKEHNLVRLVMLCGVSIIIALVMYNLLRLGPEFRQLSARNTDYIFSPLELIGRPLDPFIPHFHDISDWFPKLLTIPIIGFLVYGLWLMVKQKNRLGLVVFLWALAPLLINMAFLKTFTARYLLSTIPLILIFSGFGLNQVLEKIKLTKFMKLAVGLILVLPQALLFDYQLLKSPPPDNLPKEERMGYFEMWTAGYGLKEIAQYLIEQKKYGEVVVGTEGSFGTLPDGLYIYLDKSNISVLGSSATISAKLREAASNGPTFFVGNKKNLKVLKGVEQIMEYPKVKPLDETEADATVLYKVLP